MDFLKDILGEELFTQFTNAINAFNGNEANKDKQVKLENINSGNYVSKLKYEDNVQKLSSKEQELSSKEQELQAANNLIADLKKNSKGNEDLQNKITGYETQVSSLQKELAETRIRYAFDVLLMDAGVGDKDEREFLMYKYEKKLKEEGKALELDENNHIKNGEAVIESLKTTNPKPFENKGGDGEYQVYGDNKLPDGDNKPRTVTREQFLQMGYNDRLKLKQENEALYKQLAKN